MKKIAILGAGISGLSAAWYLKKRFGREIEIVIYEKSNRVGGWIRTTNASGFLFEEGPRGFRPLGKGKNTLELVHELGLRDQLVAADPNSKIRYLALKGKLHRFSLPFLIRHGFLKAILRDLITKKTDQEDESIASFFNRRFSSKITELVVDPLSKGIFGGDCQALSIRSCLPGLWNLEKEHRSITRGFLKQKREKAPAPLYSFLQGMESLPKRLAEALEGKIHLSTTIDHLNDVEADLIISALPSSALAGLLGEKDPLEYATLSTVNLGWHGSVLKKRGYGFLVPSREKSSTLGMTWDSEVFPAHNGAKEQTRICVMIGGVQTKAELYTAAMRSVNAYLKISEKPALCSIKTAHSAIPQYTLAYHQRMVDFKKKLPPHLIAIGNCFEGVSVNDCIFNAKRAAERVSF